MEPDAVEIRVVGCLVEKQRTTPDAYPLSLNALRLACNQSTNRDPVVEYDEALGLDEEELALLTLRGPQTPGELKQRSERLHPFADLGAVQETLGRLLEREPIVRHPRRPGQKEDRFEQVLGEE